MTNVHGLKRDPEIIRRLTRRLRAMSVEDWNRIIEATSSIRGDSIDTLWRRARHRALWFGSVWHNWILATPLFAAGELARELRWRTHRQSIAAARARGPSLLGPELHAALLELWELAAERLPDDETTIEVILIAASLASSRSADDLTVAEAWAPLAGVVALQEVR